MTSETHLSEANARRFLLGDVDESERQRIERLVILDPEVKETILIAEEDLIEEFLDGDLSAADKQKFLSRYAGTSPQREKWQIADSLRRRAATESVANQRPALAVQRFGSFVSSLWIRKRPFLIPATALAIVLGIVAIWLIDLNNRRAQERQRINSIERQLAQLNSPSELQNNPPGMLAVDLWPVNPRSASVPAEVAAESNYTIVELRLLWLHNTDYENYEAIIQPVSGVEKYKVPNLHLELIDRGNVIKLRANAEIFDRGTYQIILSSFSKDGTPGPVEEYSFVSTR